MKMIDPRMHGYLDYITVILFLAAPAVFGLTGMAATLAYALAVIHLVLTLGTDFPLGMTNLIPLAIHGWVERIVGPLLILTPFVPGITGDAWSRNFYVAVGIIIVLVGLLTDYEGRAR